MVHPLTDAYNAGYSEAVEKACKWLNQNTDWGERDSYEGEIEEVFRKVMEE